MERDKILKRIAEKRALLESRGDVKVKIPRTTLPTDFNITTQPLFSLPPKLLKPMVASGYPSYRKKMAALKKKGITSRNTNKIICKHCIRIIRPRERVLT